MSKYFLIFLVILSPAVFGQTHEPINSVEIFIKGRDLFDEGKFEESLAEYEKIDRNDTNYVSALIKKSLIYLQLEKYEEGVKVAREGLSLNSDEEYTFYINLGVLCNKAKRHQEALDIFNEGLKKFPKSFLMKYNKGVVYKAMEKLPEAIQMYKESILLNPYYANAHLNLGLIAADEGKVAQAMLSLNMFLMIEPETSRSLFALQKLNEIVSSKYEKNSKDLILSPEGGDDFSEMDLIITNYAALSKSFKVPSKINHVIVKQDYALFSKMEYIKSDKGFWMQTYVPFFKEIVKQNKFEIFSYHIFQTSGAEDHRKVVKKNAASIAHFVTWAKEYMDKIQSFRMVQMNGTNREMQHFYDINKHSLGLICNVNPQNGKLTGDAEYYFITGMLSAKGVFNNNGEKEGFWTFYSSTGNKSEESSYNNGVINGGFKVFYRDGTIKSTGTYVNGKVQGERKDFNKVGAVNAVYYYKDNVIEGKVIAYFNTGEKEYEGKYVQGTLSDTLIENYANGALGSLKMMKNSITNGDVKTYYRSGKLFTQGQSLNGRNEGEYKSYYENGQLQKTGLYKEGLQIGSWKEYYQNGVLRDESLFDEKGKLNGSYKSYAEDGKLFAVWDYVHDEIVGYKNYDKDGKVIKENRKQKGDFEFKVFYSDGVVKAEGLYTAEGKKGLWKYYDHYGNLKQEENYNSKGKVEGKVRNLFPGGQVEDECMFKDNQREGYYVSYHSNGKISQEGWFRNGCKEGYWNTYFPDGILELRNYYINDNLSGYQQEFNVTGKLEKEEICKDGLTEKTIFYDTLGAVTETVFLEKETGTWISHYNNKKERVKGPYILGAAHGKFLWYHYNGKLSVEGSYHNGKKNDIWKWYDDEGKLKTEGSYYFGDQDGTWNYYFPDGKLKTVEHFDKGEKAGEAIWYFPNQKVEIKKIFKNDVEDGQAFFYDETGALQMVRIYKDGKVLSYSYLDATGKLVDFINVPGGTAKCISYYQNGVKAREFNLVKGEFQGTYIENFSNGKVHESINYKNNENEGPYRENYLDGTLRSEENYFSGELHGLCKYYYPNGKLKKELNYNKGNLHGICKYYNESGTLTKTKHYCSDIVLKEINY
jgi:uncharacterized protein